MKLDLTPEYSRELGGLAGYAQGIAAAHAGREAQALAARRAADQAAHDAGFDAPTLTAWEAAADRHEAARDEAAAARTGAAGWNLAYLMAKVQAAPELAAEVEAG